MLVAVRDAVRGKATERTWSQGVTLAREGRVTGRVQRGDELELEVRVPGRPTPFEVLLNPKHVEWECDCSSREPVCSHVVAAVLATEQSDGELPKSSIVGAPIRYLLTPDPGGIQVERVLVRGDRTEPMSGSLMSMVAKGKAGHIASIQADLTADQLIGVRGGGGPSSRSTS